MCKWIKASEQVPADGRTLYLKSDTVNDSRGQYVIGLDCFYGNQSEDYIDKKFIEWLDESTPLSDQGDVWTRAIELIKNGLNDNNDSWTIKATEFLNSLNK